MLFLQTSFNSPDPDLYFSVLDEIDEKLAQIATQVLNNVRYGFENKVNYEAYEDLIIYRDILYNIIYCATWLCDINQSSVISHIKKLVNALC